MSKAMARTIAEKLLGCERKLEAVKNHLDTFPIYIGEPNYRHYGFASMNHWFTKLSEILEDDQTLGED